MTLNAGGLSVNYSSVSAVIRRFNMCDLAKGVKGHAEKIVSTTET